MHTYEDIRKKQENTVKQNWTL